MEMTTQEYINGYVNALNHTISMIEEMLKDEDHGVYTKVQLELLITAVKQVKNNYKLLVEAQNNAR